MNCKPTHVLLFRVTGSHLEDEPATEFEKHRCIAFADLPKSPEAERVSTLFDDQGHALIEREDMVPSPNVA